LWVNTAKIAIFSDFSQKWLFLAVFQKKSPVATGLKSSEMAIFGHFL